jgi:protein phosphatase
MDHTLAAGGASFGVCDGMGGAAAGEVASQLAVDIIFNKLTEGEGVPDRDELAHRLVNAVEEAGLQIFNNARADRTHRGMGTTSTVAALVDDRLFLAQVGDSRAYVLRGGKLTQVTRDQSLVNQLIEAGQLSEEEAETFEHNNIILQALGTSETVQVDLTYVDLRRGDTLLMCSDGLSGMIKSDDMLDVLTTAESPDEACVELIKRANDAGGHDNITVIVVRFDGEGLAEVSESDEPVAYRKYPLPDRFSGGDTARPGSQPPAPIRSNPPPASEGLKVGHTMVGAMSPVDLSTAGDDLTPTERPSGRPEDEPVDLPTTGAPSWAVGFMVVLALLVIVTSGVYLLR